MTTASPPLDNPCKACGALTVSGVELCLSCMRSRATDRLGRMVGKDASDAIKRACSHLHDARQSLGLDGCPGYKSDVGAKIGEALRILEAIR